MKCSIMTEYNTLPPVRGSEEAAGFDVFVPKFNIRFLEDFGAKNAKPNGAFINHDREEEYIKINGHGSVIVPTGLRFNINKGEYLEVANRGSMAAKDGLIFGAHIIDSDYQGNVFINLINTTGDPVMIKPGQKVAQLLHKHVFMEEIEMIEDTKLFPVESKRGAGALGSTGK